MIERITKARPMLPARPMVCAIASAACAAAMLAMACETSDVPHDNPAQLDAQSNADTSVAPNDAGVTVLPDGAVTHDDSAVPPVSDCYVNPKTHFEIINACTDAQKIDKHPALPLLLPDGGRPLPP